MWSLTMLTPRVKGVVGRKRHPAPGSKPGTLVIGKDASPPRIHIMVYSADGLEEHDIDEVTALANHLHEDLVTWIDVQGLGDEGVLRSIADMFKTHPLVVTVTMVIYFHKKGWIESKHIDRSIPDTR